MTFSLRRKHPTTARGPRSLIRTAISLLVLALAAHARPTSAQNYPSGPPALPYPPASSKTPAALHFPQDHAGGILAVAQKDKGKDQEQVPAKQEYMTLEFR